MKNSFITLSIFIFSLLQMHSHFLESQSLCEMNKIKEITLDFKCKTLDLSKVRKLENGELYKIVIKNINMNLYNVQVNHTDSTIISNVAFPTLDLIGLDAINSVISSIVKSTSSTMSAYAEKKVELAEIVRLIQNNQNQLNKNKSTIKTFSFSKNNLKNFNKSMSKEQIDKENLKIQSKIDSVLSESIELNSELESLENQKSKILIQLSKLELDRIQPVEDPKENILKKINLESENVGDILMYSKGFIKKADSLICRINNQSLSYLSSWDSSIYVSKYIFDSKFSYNHVIDFSQMLSDSLTKIQTVCANQKSLYKSYTESLLRDNGLSEILKKDSLIKLKNAELGALFTKALAELNAAIEKISFVTISKHFSTLLQLENNSERQYSSLPLQHNAEISQLDVSIIPKKPEYGQSYKVKYLFPKSNWYAGIGGSFYYANHLSHDVYSVSGTATSDSTSNFNIVDEGKQKGEIGFATLLHIGRRFERLPWLSLNGVIGPALSLSSAPQLRMAAGGGFSFGSTKSMVSINLVMIGGYVQRRSAVFQEGVNYTQQPEQITISRLSNSGAITLGYIYKF